MKTREYSIHFHFIPPMYVTGDAGNIQEWCPHFSTSINRVNEEDWRWIRTHLEAHPDHTFVINGMVIQYGHHNMHQILKQLSTL